MKPTTRTILRIIGLGIKSRARMLTLTEEIQLLGLDRNDNVVVDVYAGQDEKDPRIEIRPMPNLDEIFEKQRHK